MSAPTRGDFARMANTRGRPITVAKRDPSTNEKAQRAALAGMSIQERETGRSAEWWAAFHAAQRASVRRRFGGEI